MNKDSLKTSENGYWMFKTREQLTPEEQQVYDFMGRTAIEETFSAWYGKELFLVWVDLSNV